MDAEFDWLTLDEDEEVYWADTPHPYSLVPAAIVGVPLSFLLVGIPVLASAYLSYRNTNYVVTSAGLYKKTGVLSRNVQRVEFDKVQDTSYRQGFFGTRFGYGTVDVSTAGGSGVELQFDNVDGPRQVQTLINERIRKREARQSDGDGAAVLDEILAELRAIRRSVEGSQSLDDTATETTMADGVNGESEERTARRTVENADRRSVEASQETEDPDATAGER